MHHVVQLDRHWATGFCVEGSQSTHTPHACRHGADLLGCVEEHRAGICVLHITEVVAIGKLDASICRGCREIIQDQQSFKPKRGGNQQATRVAEVCSNISRAAVVSLQVEFGR